jgi:serine/threonine protein kinase
MLADKYTFNINQNRLGSGAFGLVVQGRDQMGNKVAIKLESNDSKYPQVQQEYRLYKYLDDGHGVPQAHWVGPYGQTHTAMVMDSLGPSIEELFTHHNRTFSSKTVLLIADQAISRVEYMHSKGYIHRDIKPDNFLVGVGNKTHYIHLIDLGLAKKFRDSQTEKHIAMKTDKNLTGTARYASIWTH